MYDAVVQHSAHRVVRQSISAQMHHLSGNDARIARFTEVDMEENKEELDGVNQIHL